MIWAKLSRTNSRPFEQTIHNLFFIFLFFLFRFICFWIWNLSKPMSPEVHKIGVCHQRSTRSGLARSMTERTASTASGATWRLRLLRSWRDGQNHHPHRATKAIHTPSPKSATTIVHHYWATKKSQTENPPPYRYCQRTTEGHLSFSRQPWNVQSKFLTWSIL
jgi:hypothetical protein